MPTAACSRTARRLFWYLLACAIGVVLVRWLQSLEGIGMMWVFLSAVSRQQPTAVPRHALLPVLPCGRGAGTVAFVCACCGWCEAAGYD